MKTNAPILKRQSQHLFFQDADVDFMFNWQLGIAEVFGLSHGELYYLAQQIGKRSTPEKWQTAFTRHAEYARRQAVEAACSHQTAANYQLAATYAYRAALQMTDPYSAEYGELVAGMEQSFAEAMRRMDAPLEPITIAYQESYLPGYYLHTGNDRPTVMMVGGGDTYREDLFYFAGYPGWQRGYNVLMVDLPGQGTNPQRGLIFTVRMDEAISTCIDWLEQRNPRLEQLAVYGVSGGGYFSAQAAQYDERITAWIASTPIYDIARLFRQEFGAVLRAPGWMTKLLTRLAGATNQHTALALKKYAWQFGGSDFRMMVKEVEQRATVVRHEKIQCPALFLVGEGEGIELQRQAHELHDALTERDIAVTLHSFSAQSGADAHCQVNNLRLAHSVVFDWLDEQFGLTGGV